MFLVPQNRRSIFLVSNKILHILVSQIQKMLFLGTDLM